MADANSDGSLDIEEFKEIINKFSFLFWSDDSGFPAPRSRRKNEWSCFDRDNRRYGPW